jgi:hypothetical protein
MTRIFQFPLALRCAAMRNFFFVLLFLLTATPAFGQTERARLIVRVTDAQGAGVPGVTITLEEVQTRQSRSVVTDNEGVINFTDIAPGNYKIRVAALTGFTSPPEQEITIGVGASLRVELPLEPTPLIADAIRKSRTVEVSSAIVEPHEVTSSDMNELSVVPNENNDLTPLLQIVPGAVPAGGATLGRIIIDGKGAEQQTSRLDGFDATPLVDLPAGDPALTVLDSFQNRSVSAIDSSLSSVISKAFSPIYGPGVGSISESVTQRGIQKYKFQFYNLLRNDALDARNFFDYEGKNGIRRNQFGGKVGGPLIFSRAFFFVGYEGIRGRTERNIYEAVPADVACQCAVGPLAHLLGGFLPNGTMLIPGATDDANFIVARRRARATSEANAFDARLDIVRFPDVVPDSKNPSEDGLLLRFTRQTADFIVPDGITGRQQLQRLLFLNTLAKVRWTSGRLIHEFKSGLNLSRGSMDVESAASSMLDQTTSLVTIGGTIKTKGLPLLPGFDSLPVASLGGQVKDGGSGFNLNPYSFITGYNLTYATQDAAHIMNFGFEARFLRLNFNRRGGLTYAFPNVAALRAGTPSKVTFVSDLSAASPFSEGTGDTRRAAQEYYMGYFQDVWTMKAPGTQSVARKNLTLTYGFRYDLFGAVRAEDNRAVVVDPLTGTILPSGAPFYRAKRNNIQPRVGVAYELPPQTGLFADATLRAGFGFYSGVPRIGELLLPIESDRFGTAITNGTFPASASDLARNFLDKPNERQFQPLAFSRDFSTPERAYKWEVALVRKVPKFGELTLSYFGNIGRNLPLVGLANPIIQVETNPDPTQSALVRRQFDIVTSDGLISKPFAEFTYRTSGGRSAYNAMSVSLERKTGNGWPQMRWLRFSTFKTQYTLSRNMGNVSGALASDPTNFDADYGYNAADARHSFSLSATYKIWTAFSDDPAEPNHSQWNPLRGWSVGTKFSARSGLPLIVRLDRPDVVYVDASGTVFTTPDAGRRAVINTPGGETTGGARAPDLIPGINPYLNEDRLLLNPAAFAIPAPGSLGNLRRGALRGPNLFQLDLSLTRYVLNQKESKGVTAEFKVEAFNILNRPNFGNPTASLPNKLGINAADFQIQPNTPFLKDGVGNFGLITTADPGRRIQFTIQLKFNDGF